ncbi:MAG TPA: ABC transporter permease [Bryobacteraceae bacterium]|jgi:imidazolonepropionase-like amidohydrolase/ABC-type multidrug transport system permease subunit|nr:ABC transporter permease [Bryobacteraceae bacterium]
MKPYIAQIRSNLRLMGRDRSVLFFSYLFPLIFFFAFAQSYHARESAAIMAQVIAMVLIIGILGNGFFGAGMRAVQDRETNVLRRFKVAPVGPSPIIVASMVSGLVAFLPSVFLFFFFGTAMYHMPLPRNLLSVIVFVCIGVLAFRSMGMIIAAVANSAQEAGILVQILYLPMLFISGATFPLSMMPRWMQNIAEFLPATYLYQGIQSMMLGGESLARNLVAVGALIVALCVALFVGTKLFRWEKEEKISNQSKLWILGVLSPFLILGLYQAKTQQNVEKAKILARNAARSGSVLFQNAKIFVGDGTVIPNGSVLVRNQKIAQVFTTPPEDPKSLNAEVVDAAGKTLLPGLIDMQVHLDASGGVHSDSGIKRRLAAYLYSGITAVRSTGDPPEIVSKLAQAVNSGAYLGAEVFTGGSNTAYDPGLSALEANIDLETGNPAPLNRSLLQQAAPAGLLKSTRVFLERQKRTTPNLLPLERAKQNLLAACKAGLLLVTGSGAGSMLVIHGPTVQNEMELWVKAGIPPAVALKAATFNAATALHADNRIGLIREGHDATLILLDGDPLQDIANTEHIYLVMFRGERINRPDLFNQDKQ